MTNPGSPALNEPVLSAERRALEMSVRILRVIARKRSGEESQRAELAERVLAEIAALVPDAGKPR